MERETHDGRDTTGGLLRDLVRRVHESSPGQSARRGVSSSLLLLCWFGRQSGLVEKREQRPDVWAQDGADKS